MTGLEELSEKDIEEAIRLELAALDNLDLKKLESSDAKYESTDVSDTETKLSSEEKYGLPPDSVETFIKLLQSKNDKLQEELAAAEDVVRSASQHENVITAAENEEDDMKISPELKEKVLHEIEGLDKDDIVNDKKDTDDEDISSLEENALRSLKELKLKQDKRSDQLNSLFSEIKEDEIIRHEKEERIREENKQKANKEHEIKMNENQSLKMKIEEEAKLQQQKLQNLQKQFELEMNDLEKRRKEEKLALEKMQSEERRKQDVQKELACITIQKNFRMYRVQSKYDKELKLKREERQKQRQAELDALERKEQRLMEEAVQKEKEEEMRRLTDIENEKKRKEEEEKKRLEDERRRLEEEENRRRFEKQQEEQRKIELERRRQEEERLERERLEKEELERKIAEEKKRQEEEKRMRIEEQRKIEEERKLEEEKRLEEERKFQQKKLEEQRELEQKKLEEEKRLKEERKLEQKKLEKQRELEQMKLNEHDVIGSHDEKNAGQLLRKTVISESLNQANESGTSDNVLISKEHKLNNTISTTKEKSIDASDESILEWERCREKWLKRTVLWSTTLSMDEKANVKSRSKPRRPLSASQKLPSLSEEELLKSQNKIISLDKIDCINVKGLPPRNLKIMSKCLNVKSVAVQNCSLLSAESFDNCNHLLQLNLSDNSIRNISCQNLHSLQSLDLRNNQLTSIHGLDGCHNLRSLHLDGNKITRIGTLPFNKVIDLALQNNQLITTKGLSTWKYLQILDCSNNHLSQIQELDSCPLLRILKLRGNNLRKPPDLSNHVLLRELDLGENSISSLEDFSDQWLPLLQHLYVDNNSLSNVCPLRNFPMLETFDVNNNLVSDEENLLPGLTGCLQLQSLNIHGNPVCEDTGVRFGIVKTLPNLKFLDGEKLESVVNKDRSAGKTIFYPICSAQIIAQDKLLEKQKYEIENCQAESNDDNLVVRRLELQTRHFQELQDLMIEHRVQHENFKKAAMTYLEPQMEKASFSSTLSQQNNESEQSEAVKSVSNANDKSSYIPSLGVSVVNTTAGNGMWKPSHHEAATLIQARFRGYRIRKRYLEATQTAQYSDNDLEYEDFNFDEEVDLNMFDMDEAALDSSWLPTNTPGITRDSIDHNESASKQEQENKQQVGYYNLPKEMEDDGKLPSSQENQDTERPFPRKHAWRSPDSPLSTPNPRHVIPPIKAPSVLSEQTSPPGETHRSHRTSELSSEWGFSKNSTAELMLKRANRMKYNALRKKKMTNPEKRYQLFKKADESNKARGVQTVQKRKAKPKVDYFSGRPYGDHEMTKNEEQESQAKKEMTFSWVYDQAVLHKDQEEEILRDTRGYYSESKPDKNRLDRSPPGVSLPRMDPVILAGRNLPLVASPVSNPRTPSIYSGDVEIGSRRKYSWQQAKTLSNPDLTRVGRSKESRSGKSNSAEARIIKERNHIL